MNLEELNNDKEIKQLDTLMLQLIEQRNGKLTNEEITNWLIMHYSNYFMKQIMQNESLILVNSIQSFNDNYHNVSEFKTLYNFCQNKQLENTIFSNAYQEFILTFKEVPGLSKIIKIKKQPNGWLIKNKWLYGKILTLLGGLMAKIERFQHSFE